MNLIPILQIVVSIAIIVLILLQERSSGMSGLLGGDGSGTFQTRRGFERAIFMATIVLAILFAGLAVVELLI